MSSKQTMPHMEEARRILVTQIGEEYHYILYHNYLKWKNPVCGTRIDEVRG